MRIGDRLLLVFAPPLASVLIRVLHLTIRSNVLGQDHLQGEWKREQKVILTAWHDQLLMLIPGLLGETRALISSSKDGELIARVLRSFGHDAVRGSSSRGGSKAFKALLRLAREPIDFALTPDGPKGPRHRVKDGVIQLARMTGRPVIPLAYVCSKGHRFASWDRFLCPYPFSRAVYSYGEAVFYQPDESIESFRERIEQAMLKNQRLAEENLEALGATAV